MRKRLLSCGHLVQHTSLHNNECETRDGSRRQSCQPRCAIPLHPYQSPEVGRKAVDSWLLKQLWRHVVWGTRRQLWEIAARVSKQTIMETLSSSCARLKIRTGRSKRVSLVGIRRARPKSASCTSIRVPYHVRSAILPKLKRHKTTASPPSASRTRRRGCWPASGRRTEPRCSEGIATLRPVRCRMSAEIKVPCALVGLKSQYEKLAPFSQARNRP